MRPKDIQLAVTLCVQLFFSLATWMPGGTRQGLSPENANGTHVFAGLGHSGLKVFMREVSQGSVTHYRILDCESWIADFMKTASDPISSTDSTNPINGKCQGTGCSVNKAWKIVELTGMASQRRMKV